MGVGNRRVLLSVRERSDAGLSDGCCPIGIPMSFPAALLSISIPSNLASSVGFSPCFRSSQ